MEENVNQDAQSEIDNAPKAEDINMEITPAPVTDTAKPVIIVDKKERRFAVLISINQAGLRDKTGELVDPYNNTLFKLEYESKGDVVDIARAAGRITNDVCMFYESIKGKGIRRDAGFNLEMNIIDESKEGVKSEKLTSISKVRLSSEVDVAFAIAKQILIKTDNVSVDGYFTGEFNIGADAALFFNRLKLDEQVNNLPMLKRFRVADDKRKSIKKHVQNTFKSLQN